MPEGDEGMKVIVKGRNINVTNTLREYAVEKMAKMTKYLDQIMQIEIEFIVEKNPSIANAKTVEATVFTKGPVIRAKESSSDMYASIDLVVDKLERQIKRYKGKLKAHNVRTNGTAREALLNEEQENEVEASEESRKPRIVKVKQFSIKPMSPVEASMQMELLGHDFYVFTNAETDEVNVVYRRKDNNYGLIEPVGA
jgi:putative sigma-54 modulation protein